jgi:hypothetical protein
MSEKDAGDANPAHRRQHHESVYQDHGHGGAGVATSVVMPAPRHDTGGKA